MRTPNPLHQGTDGEPVVDAYFTPVTALTGRQEPASSLRPGNKSHDATRSLHEGNKASDQQTEYENPSVACVSKHGHQLIEHLFKPKNRIATH